MRFTLLLFCITLLAPLAMADELFFSGTSGTNLIVGTLEESQNKLILKSKLELPAPGTVGITSLYRRNSSDLDLYFSYTRPSTGAPAFGRFTYAYTPNFSRSSFQLFPQPLGSYGNLGAFGGSDPGKAFFFRTSRTAKDNTFVFNVNPAGNPYGAGRRFYFTSRGETLRCSAVSRGGGFGTTSTFLGSGNRFNFCTIENGAIVKNNQFSITNSIINLSVSNRTSAGNPILLYRELAHAGSRYQTSVFCRPFDATTGLPGPGKRLVGPVNIAGGPGTFSYDSIFYNTSAISPNGRWAFYTRPGAGCPYDEWWARRMTSTGGFAGAPFKPFGNCNVALGDGTVRALAFRSVSMEENNFD